MLASACTTATLGLGQLNTEYVLDNRVLGLADCVAVHVAERPTQSNYVTLVAELGHSAVLMGPTSEVPTAQILCPTRGAHAQAESRGVRKVGREGPGMPLGDGRHFAPALDADPAQIWPAP